MYWSIWSGSNYGIGFLHFKYYFMHRKKKEAELLSLDLEIESTLTRLRKLKITEQEDMGDNT